MSHEGSSASLSVYSVLFNSAACVLQGEGAAASLPPTLDPTIMEAQGFDQDGMLRLVAKPVPASQEAGVLPARFWAAGFSFSHAQLFAEVRA